MLPSEVRARILEDHGYLRGELDALAALCGRVLQGEKGLEDDLRGSGERFQRRFLEHLALEDEHLRPALRRADAWGEERAARLAQEHEQQRSFLESILASLRDPARSCIDIALELRGLVAVIFEDMEHEETAVLDPEVLRDDVVSISMETG